MAVQDLDIQSPPVKAKKGSSLLNLASWRILRMSVDPVSRAFGRLSVLGWESLWRGAVHGIIAIVIAVYSVM